MAVGLDRRMHVHGRLNDKGVESYEVEEGLCKLKGGKELGLDQCAVFFFCGSKFLEAIYSLYVDNRAFVRIRNEVCE